jgi:hypothetical protein
MNLNMRAGFGLSLGVSSLFALILASTTLAADRAVPNGAGRWMALDKCATHGPGLTLVESTTGCVKIGGHVRVEFGTRGVAYYQYTSRVTTGATTAAIRTDNLAGSTSDLAEPRHLRVGTDDPYGYDPFVEPTSSASKTTQ